MGCFPREKFEPATAVGIAIKAVAQAVQGAAMAVYHGVAHLDEALGWAVHHPFEALDSAWDWSVDQVLDAWNDIRKTYGSGVQAINTIETILDSPCEDKWSVILETALPAAGCTFWILLIPQPSEVLEEYLQPYSSKASRRDPAGDDKKRRRRSRSGKLRRVGKYMPNPDTMVASRVPGAQAVKGRNVGHGQKWVFDGVQALDRIKWWWMLVDLSDDFLIQWTSMMQEARFCSRPTPVILRMTAVNPDTFSHQWWDDLTQVDIEQQKNIYVSAESRFGWNLPLRHSGTAVVEGNFTFFNHMTATLTQELRLSITVNDEKGFREEKIYDNTVTLKPGETKTIHVSGTLDAAGESANYVLGFGGTTFVFDTVVKTQVTMFGVKAPLAT